MPRWPHLSPSSPWAVPPRPFPRIGPAGHPLPCFPGPLPLLAFSLLGAPPHFLRGVSCPAMALSHLPACQHTHVRALSLSPSLSPPSILLRWGDGRMRTRSRPGARQEITPYLGLRPSLERNTLNTLRTQPHAHSQSGRGYQLPRFQSYLGGRDPQSLPPAWTSLSSICPLATSLDVSSSPSQREDTHLFPSYL